MKRNISITILLAISSITDYADFYGLFCKQKQ